MNTKDLKILSEWSAKCKNDPLKFVIEGFDWGRGELEKFDGPDTWQIGILKNIRDGLLKVDEAIRLAVASGHGIGKSALVAWIVLWAISTVVDTKGVVTANTENQLRLKTWAELAKWHRLVITKELFTCAATAIYSTDDKHERTWRIDMVPWSLNNTEAFAGLHNQGKRLLLIFDEASAIPNLIWEVSEGALTDSDTQIMWLAFGNPTRNTGRFKDCFGRYRKRWLTKNIDSRTAKMVNNKQVNEWVEDYGEDSDFVKVRVRGMFPSSSAKQFISVENVDGAYGRILREEQYKFAPVIITCDPAAEGDDDLVISKRQGLSFNILRVLPKNDNDFEVGAILARYEDQYRAAAVNIDGGFGTGIVSYGRTLGRSWNLIWFNGKPPEPSCINMRAYMWKCARDWLKQGGAIEKDQELYDDLIGPETVARLDGKIQLESKSDMKKRGLPSPNKGDTLALSFAVPIIETNDNSPSDRLKFSHAGGSRLFAKTRRNPLSRR